jgi:hypothetical protein
MRESAMNAKPRTTMQVLGRCRIRARPLRGTNANRPQIVVRPTRWNFGRVELPLFPDSERSGRTGVVERFSWRRTSMSKRFWLTTTAAVLMSTAAFAESGTNETPSAAPLTHQERSSERPDAASSPRAQSPSAASDTQSLQAPRPPTTPSAHSSSSERGAADRTNADRENTEKPSKATASDKMSDEQKEGTTAREDARPNS